MQDGKVVDRLEGADIPSLTSKVNKLCPAAAGGKGKNSVSGSIAPAPVAKQTDMAAATEKVKKLVRSQPVMLFMKVGSLDSCFTQSACCSFCARIAVDTNGEGGFLSARMHGVWDVGDWKYIRMVK